MPTTTNETQHLQEENIRIVTRRFLYELHRLQNCCEVCSHCRRAIIDQSLKLARLYAVLANDTE